MLNYESSRRGFLLFSTYWSISNNCSIEMVKLTFWFFWYKDYLLSELCGMQVQNPHNIKYNGTLQGLKYIWRTEGFKGLFKGNGTNCARIVPNSAVKFFSYEQASRYASSQWLRFILQATFHILSKKIKFIIYFLCLMFLHPLLFQFTLKQGYLVAVSAANWQWYVYFCTLLLQFSSFYILN